MNIKWNEVKPLQTKKNIAHFELAKAKKLNKELKKCVIKFNAGRPEPHRIKSKTKFNLDAEYEFDRMTSFNQRDSDNVWDSNRTSKQEDVVFGHTTEGYNVLIRNEKKVYVEDKYLEDYILVADDFKDFLRRLY